MGDITKVCLKKHTKSQAKPLFSLLVCIIVLSSAVFAEGYADAANETADGIIKEITKIMGLIFSNNSITAMLVLENDSPVAGEELLFYENETAISSGITNGSGSASIGYFPENGEHNISVFFFGTENLSASGMSEIIIINNTSNETANNETGNITQQQTIIGEIIEISFSKLSILQGEIMIISARLSYENSTPIQGEELGFYENDSYLGSNITDENGTAILSVNTSASTPGNFTINVTHNSFWNVSAVEIFAHDNPASEANETNTTENNSANITAPLNETNITVEEFEATQGFAETGKPVAWTKKIRVRNNAGENAAHLINISVDGNAQNIIVEDNVSKKETKLKSTGIGIASNKKDFEFGEMLAPRQEKEYLINYETPAPEKIEGENETSGAEWKKKVTIFSDYSYKNVSSYTDITESDEANIHLFWNVSGALVDVTNSAEINLTYVDTNNNGKIDRIYWIVPHLSEQEFMIVIDLAVINVQSYPAVGGNWTVRFTTAGTANLTISAIDGTLWSNDTEEKDLKFLELKCGADSITSEWNNDSVFIENYFCNETSYETSKVLTSGKHHLRFQFGDDVEYANNMAGCTLSCDSASNNVCIISSAKEVLTNCYIDDNVLGGNTSIEIQNGGSIYNNSNAASFAINVTGNITIKSGGNIAGNVNISAVNLTIESGGKIDARGKGYVNAAGPGAGTSNAPYNGGGGPAYGTIATPIDFGSGGGNGNGPINGGYGGGAIKLNISGTLTVNGLILANGSNYGASGAGAGSDGGGGGYGGRGGAIDSSGGWAYSGGGSGGSVYIVAGTFAGTTGYITTAGGQSSGEGGGGGGGRIAIHYTAKTYTGTAVAYGMDGYNYGAAGTIYMKSASQSYGDLTIDNDYNSNAQTTLNSSAYSTAFDTLTVRNAANVSSAVSPLPLNATTIIGNGTLYLGTNSASIRTANISMPAGSITSTTGQINITFTSSINSSNFKATLSTANAIRIVYGSIALSTGFTAQSTITRTFISLSNQQTKWNDTNQSGAIIAYYNFTGLLANTQYLIYNTSLGSTTNPYSLTTDSNGALNFNISLNGNTEIRLATQNYALCSGICDVGSSGNTCIIGSAKSTYSGCLIDDSVIDGYNSILINGTGSIYNNTNNASFAINITGNLTIKSGGNITGNVNISAVNLTIESGGKIDANSKGYVYDKGPGRGWDAGGGGTNAGGSGGGLIRLNVSGKLTNNGSISASGGNGASLSTSGASGASYGGDGGMGAAVNGGTAYGSIINLNNFGSGGGSSYSGSGGGGAGGGIFINSSIFEGNGTIFANGGNPGTQSYAAGGGGGGRIAIYYTAKTYSGTITAYGGVNAYSSYKYSGGAGTIYLKNNSQTYGDLTIDNNGRSGAQTPLDSSAYSTAFDTLTVRNAANVSSAVSPLPLNATTFIGNGTLYMNTNSVNIRTSNISMSGGSITSASGQINITFTNSINSSTFNTTVSTSSGAIKIWYGATPQDRCDISGATISGATPSYYYAQWSNTTAYRCVKAIIVDSWGVMDASNTTRTQLNANEVFYPSFRIREYNGTDYFDVGGNWNITIYSSNGSVLNTTHNTTNTTASYFWKTQASYSESTGNAYSFYSNITGVSAVGMVNYSNAGIHTYSVKGIFVTESLNASFANPADTVFVSGKAVLQPDGTDIANTNASVWLNDTFQSNATTNSTGHYNYTLTAPITAGNHSVKVNITNADGIYGSNETNLSVRINISSPSAKGITTGIANVNVNENVNLSITIPTGNINYPSLNLSHVWVNISNSTYSQIFFLTGNISGGMWWNTTFSSATPGTYNSTYHANLTDGFSAIIPANTTFNVKQLNITYQINDTIIYASEYSLINGTIYRETEHAISASALVNITLNSGSSDAGGKITNAGGRYNFTYIPTAVASITTINFTLNATDTEGINGTTTNSSAFTVYPAIAIDTWASTTSACSDRTDMFNIAGTKFLCANITYGTSKTAGAYVNFSISDIGSYAYGDANPVFTNNSVYDAGTIASSPISLNESTKYRITATAWNPSINALISASDTYDFNYGQFNISANLTDYVIMPGENITIIGKVYDYFNEVWTRINTFVRIFLDGVELTNGGHYNKTWTTNAGFSNGTSVNVTNSSNSLVLDPRGEYYFEAESFVVQSNTYATSDDANPIWDGTPSGGQYITSNHPAWANYNITGIPNGTYYIFVKMRVNGATSMANITWDGAYINVTQRSAGYVDDILWSDSLATPAIINATSHILGFNSTTNGPSIDVILLTTNSSYIPNNTDQTYVSVQTKYSGYFTSNKTTTDYQVISITPNWTSNEPAGSNITVDISANNGASWCSNVTKREYRTNESCGAIGSGTELIWRANLSTNNSFAALRLINVTMIYETGNTTKTNSSGFFSLLFNALKTLGWHNITINTTDSEGINGNLTMQYFTDNLTITTNTTPEITDGDTLSQTINVTISSNGGRTSGRRYNITAIIANPGDTSDTIVNSSFSCTDNYPMTCSATWAPGIQPLGWYNVTIDFEDNESITGQNTTYDDFDVDNITTTVTSSDIAPIIAKNITISGTARTNSSALLKSANITLTTSSAAAHLCGYNTSISGAQYSWSINCSIDSAGYSGELGPATINVRINDTTGTIWGQNATSITIWAPTIVNYTNSTSYAGTNTEYNITGYYWRTDVLGAIQGLINITVFNSTYSLSKTCSGASSCLKNFTIGPSGELAGGNYTIWINASNDSAYYMPSSTQYFLHLEEPKASGTINTSNKIISNMVGGVDYSYIENIKLNNSNRARMYSPSIWENVNYGACTEIKSVANLTPKSCSDTSPNSQCIVQFNITIAGNACPTPPCDIGCLDWNSNWTNNDVTTGSATDTAYIVSVSGNPNIDASILLINITDNIGVSNITNVQVNNSGNERLGESGQPANSIFVDFISQTMPTSWIGFYSAAGSWNDANDYWDFMNSGTSNILQVNTTATNYSAGTYTGIINITSYRLGALQAYTEINVSITISPNMSISRSLINHTSYIGSPNITNISLEGTGNAPVTNVTIIYVEETLPSSWINFSSPDAEWNAITDSFTRVTEYTNRTLQVNLTALNYTPGTYTGKINITTTEGIYRTINVSATIAPAIALSQYLVNITQNISTENSTIVIVQSTGNAPVTNVTVVLTNSTIPTSWITLSSNETEWNAATNSFTKIMEETGKALNVTIKALNYTEGIYSGILNITSNEIQNTQINLSITVNPNATTYAINKAEEHGKVTEVYHIINSTGNAPLINATATYHNSTLPSSWIFLKYGSQNGSNISLGNITEGNYKNITVDITIPEYQAPGNYVGYINTTFDNEPTRQATITLTVNTNSSWYIQPPENKSYVFLLSESGTIGNVTLVNTGNVPLNYTIAYIKNAICDSYSCMNGAPSEYNPPYISVNKNSTQSFGVWQKGSATTKSNAEIIVNISNSSGTPINFLAYMWWNITNSAPKLINLTTSPKNYIELNKSTTLYAIISDDEEISASTGLNLSTIYFNVTDPTGYTYTINNNSIYYWDDNDHVGNEQDRKKFNYSFANTTAVGIHNLTVYIKDKSNNEINITVFQFEVIGATTINISASTPSAAANITSLHGENLTVPINITNIGRATAYNITITGIFGNGTAWNRTYSQLNESQSIQSNITLEINAGTEPGGIPLTPKAIWTQPNTTLAENITAYNITITVDQNPELALPDAISVDMNHSSKKNITFYANSTGNYKYVFAKSYIVPETTQLNWTCFTNNCPIGYSTKDNYGEFLVNDSKTIKVFAEIPAGTSPGNYTFAVVMNSTSYGPERGKRTNVTITVLADRAWSYSRPYNASTFELNTPGIAGIITLNGSGNTGTNFTISYNNWSDKDYHSYPGLFNESQNNSGTIVNPTSITLQPNELKNITIYHNGYYQGITNLGINITISNSTAMPAIQSVLMLFNLTETAPNITDITFFNASYVELNKTIGIKVHARDDASLNLSTIRVNITDPLGGATVTVTPENTSENLTAYGKYIRMNFTYLFANTSIAGNYTVNASISDEYSPTPYNTQSAQYAFQVIGATTMNLSANATSYALGGITQASGNNITLAINATNTGFVTAYNATLSGNFSANASSWTVFNASLGNISASATSAANLTIYAPAATWPGTYYFTPSIKWRQPNGSIAQYISSPISIIVASNKTVVLTEYSLNFTISHGTTNSTTIRINSTGNDNVTNLMIYTTNVPSNFTVTLNQSTISTIPAGESRQIVLNITPNSGITNSTYSFDLNVNNDTSLLSTYHYTIIVPASYSWVKNKNSTAINAIAGQNAIDSSINVTNNGNVPVSLTFSPVGDVVSANILVSAVEPSKTIQPLQTYAIQLNHTAKNENAYYTGTLIIGNGSAFENVALDYYSYIAELNIINISPNYNVLSGNALNITTQVLFGGNNITENITYTIAINGTSCAISQNSTNGGYVVHTCTAPSIEDGTYHNISMGADYLFTTGIVPMSASNASAIYYKDITTPKILAHSITSEQEILKNISVNATLYDNILIDTAIAEIKFPNGTAYANLTLSNTTASNYSTVFAAPDTVGIYTAKYYVNDTTGNLNSSVTDSFEIYEWANFSGLMQDMNSNPVDVSFNVTNSSGGQITFFQTNASGNYNATLKKKTYGLEMSFLNSTVQLSDVDFASLPSDFIDIDRPLVGDYGFQGNVLKGFAVNTSLTSSGTLTIYYSAAEASTYLTNYFQIYRCVNWDYSLRNCNNGLSKLTSTHDKINRKLSASFTEMGTFLLVEDLPKDRPEMTIPTSLILGDAEHGKTNISYLTVQSTGSLAITRIDFSCISGTVCTSFNVSAATILGFDAGATYDEPINITIPRYYAPGTYEGTFEAISNRGSVYEQVKDITIRITVLEDSNWTVQSNITLYGIGGGANGTFPSFAIKNNANLPVYFTISPNTTDITADPTEMLVAKNSSVQITLNYIAPQSVSYYNYSINISGTGTDLTKEIIDYAALNVTHAINITEITPSENISVGQNMLINATASYLGTPQTSNISWTVFMDETPCDNITHSYNTTNWLILCKAPNMSAKLSYALKLKGTFGNYGGLVAYASAYDLANIYYVDTIPPQITNMTESGEESGSNKTINITIADYSNITNFTISLFAPNGTLAGVFSPAIVVNKTYSLTYNFSEIGDYLLRCSMIDSLNNNGTEDKYFEVFRNMTFSGKVEKANTNGTWTSFKLYRPGQNFSESQIIQEFSSGVDGKYNQTIHYRSYDIEIDVNGENNKHDTIKLYDVNLTEYSADPIDIDFVSANNAQIENANELRGIAVKTSINTSGRITLYYTPSASTYEDNINVYKCADWNFTRSRCDGTWTKINGSAGDLDTSNDKISADITGFSAYIAAEATQPIIVELSGTPPITVSGGGGGGGGDYTSAISDIKQKITTLIEGTSEFSVDTKSISKQLYPGERVNIAVGVKNALNESVRMTAKANGEFANFATFGNAYLDLGAQESGTFNMELFIPKSAYPGNYEGKVLINNGKVDTIVPVSIRILDSKNLPITVDVQPLVDNVAPGSMAKVKVGIINTGSNELPIDYVVDILDPLTGMIVAEAKGSLIAVSSESLYLNFSIPENITLESSQSQGFENVKTKRYMVRATVKSSDPAMNIKAESVSFISVTERLNVMKISVLGIPIWVFLTVALLSTTGYIGRKRYIAWVSSKKKYAETLDFKSLPQASTRSAFIGKIAETDIRTFIDLDTLQMHTIVAGSTGGGKTVAAQIIVEEALLKGAAVVVFDPTAQWSGFLRPNRDKKMLKTYGRFDMKVGESRAFNGNIREITDAHQIVDVTKYMNPGEITIFTMNHMDTKDIDFFVANTVKEVFHAGLEGAQKLKLLMVYDEVHRLLAKYGGTGDGFIQLERGVREFRKWGIGLVLISQVLSDFIGTIKANIGTEIQVRSRDESDLERIKMKYGEDMMRSIVKAAVGEGLLQNAQYNKGRPYFVSFRPLLHATERISDEELKKYSKYNGKIDDLKYQIECLKAEAVDVFDIELELKLTSENLMKGKFNMVDIYLEELEPKVASMWKKLGKEPKKRTVAYASDEDIKKEVERAKREREDYIKKQKMDEEKAKAAAGPGAGKKDEKEGAKAPKTEDVPEAAAGPAPAKKEGTGMKEEKAAEKTETPEPEEKTEESPKAAAKPQEWTTEKEHKKSRKAHETHDKDYHESIKQEVIKDIRKRAKEEDARVAAGEDAGEKKQAHEKKPENSIKDMEQELNALYGQLKEKIAENKKNGKDVSVVSLKSITLPSDIKLAAVDENPAELKKIKGKIEALMNKL